VGTANPSVCTWDECSLLLGGKSEYYIGFHAFSFRASWCDNSIIVDSWSDFNQTTLDRRQFDFPSL